jgi:hypothetical protein
MTTVRDLINQLEMIAEEHGDNTEVRMTYQQNYPLTSKIKARLFIENEADDRDARDLERLINTPGELDDEKAEARAELARIKAIPVVVHIVEGSHVGYGSRKAWEA